MSKEQRLSFFLENYFSDATEKKSSDNHYLMGEGTGHPEKVVISIQRSESK